MINLHRCYTNNWHVTMKCVIVKLLDFFSLLFNFLKQDYSYNRSDQMSLARELWMRSVRSDVDGQCSLRIIISVPARLGKRQGAKEIWHNLAR